MTARIYRPAMNAMQSGRGRTDRWLLEFEPEMPLLVEPLMGYTSSADMKRQIRLMFDTRDEAIAYAERHGIPYHADPEQERRVRPKSYSDNFRVDRPLPWTH